MYYSASVLIGYLGKAMRRGLLRSGAGVGCRSDASSGTASSGPAIALRVLTAERESFWAQAEAGHTICHVLLQGVEETHFYCDAIFLS